MRVVRVVYDASARSANSPSLNDCLLNGPKFNQLIFDLLVRFRSYRVALTADLEKAFLMVSVEEADRDVLRFLWVKVIKREPPEFAVYRFKRVVFGVSSSPFLLNATIRFNLEKYLKTNEVQVRRLLRSTYVDDVIAGGETEDEAFELYLQSKQIFREGGFNLRKFLTNSRRLQELIDLKETQHTSSPLEDEPTYSEATLGVSQPSRTEEHKVLGVPWNPVSDQLVFDTSNVAQLALELSPTKRNIVSLIGKFYDPLGFLSPVIRFKILFQKLCQCKADWDEIIPEELNSEWKLLVTDLMVYSSLSMPRSYFCELADPTISATLYGFCDASTKAYATVVYLVLKTETEGSVQFVAAKTRVAPLKSQTIPRLELLSALLLSRLITESCTSEEPNNSTAGIAIRTPSLKTYHYSSQQPAASNHIPKHQVLYRFPSGSVLDPWKRQEWKQFVQNRVTEIRNKVHPNYWYHCPGTTNPADLPSRGVPLIKLSVSHLWRSGPEWLLMDTPIHPIEMLPMSESCYQELRLKTTPSHNVGSKRDKCNC